MPWTTILESEFRMIAMLSSAPSARSQLCGPPGRAVHRVHLLQPRQVCGSQDLTTQVGIVAVQAYHQWNVDMLVSTGQQPECMHDPVGHCIAGCDAAKHVHEDALHLLIANDDLQAAGHDLRTRAAADVKKIRRPR